MVRNAFKQDYVDSVLAGPPMEYKNMSVFRCILPDHARDESPHLPKVREGEFTAEELEELNSLAYNIYFLPNYPSSYDKNVRVDGSHIDTFEYVFLDMDLKDNKYLDKEEFIVRVMEEMPEPSRIVDSGNGVHVYYRVSDLDAMSFLKLQRRLCRKFDTDEAVSKIFQLMRLPGTVNTKHRDGMRLAEEIYTSDAVYTCEALDALLPPITHADEEYCKAHYDKTYKLNQTDVRVTDKIPSKFGELIRTNKEVKDIWGGNTDDRSRSDYRLGHIMFANGFTKDEAASVLVNSAKALARAPVHRLNYATGIIEKIWTFENAEGEGKNALDLSQTVRQILEKHGDAIKGTRFPCHRYLDDTEHGFRLGQVIGLVAGSGVGKTAMALNMFEGFVRHNPDFHHFFIPLEQPANEIADRWKNMCGENKDLYDKVHIISNYAEDGSFRHLSFDEIKDYILKWQDVTGKKAGCIVIDHIGALKKKGRDGENQDLMDICHQMKAFAVQTNTMLVMQSQAPREKAGIGDLELNKDSAYGTVYYESYCDYLITLWQPLKRSYASKGCPTVTAFKFCKIRHKKQTLDAIKEDVCYRIKFDSLTERFDTMTQDDEKAFDFWNKQCVNKRKQDRKTELVTYTSLTVQAPGGDIHGKTNNNQDVSAIGATQKLPPG